MYTEIVSLSAPDSISPGGIVNVEVMVRNNYAYGIHIYCVGVLNTVSRFIDYKEANLMPYEATVFSGSFIMPGYDSSIGVYIYYEGQDGNLYPDAEASKQISVVGGQVEKWWITVAKGNTLSELEANSTGSHVHGPFRMIISTQGAPSWVLQSGAWLFNALQVPLNAIGVGLTNVQVEGNKIYVYMHGSPFAILPIVGAIGLVLTTLAVIWYCHDLVVQQEITKQLAINLETTKTKQEVTNAIIAEGYPAEVVNTLVKAVWDSGYKPTTDGGIAWETYLRWALIGGGVILGTYLLLPMVVNLRKK